MFSCEFCEIPKNTFFTEHIWTTASEIIQKVASVKNFTQNFVSVFYLENTLYLRTVAICNNRHIL